MAENQPQEQKSARKARIPKFRNWVINLSNKYLGTHFHEIKPEGHPSPTIFRIFEDLQKELNLEKIGTMNFEMVEAEQLWDGGTPETNEKAAAFYKQNVQDLYFALGHFCDVNALALEHQIIREGTNKWRDGWVKDENGRRIRRAALEDRYNKEKISIDIQGLGHREFEFLAPYEEEIKFNHGLSYKIAFLGTGPINNYFIDIGKRVVEFMNNVRQELENGKDETTKNIIQDRFENVRVNITQSIRNLSVYFNEFEDKHRSFMSGLHTKIRPYGDLQRFVLGMRLKPNQVIFRHTYRIINPEKLKIRVPNFKVRVNEVDIGLDENGWPLEVAEENYSFITVQENGNYSLEHIPNGTILLDVFNGEKPYRIVPPEYFLECTEYVDLLELATWVYVNYDAYRDDLRDGRYHTKSLSIMEYLLKMRETETYEIGFEKAKLNQDIWIDKKENNQIVRDNSGNPIRIVDTQHMKTTMNLNGPPPGRPENVEVIIEPSHLNPAFDLRRGKEDSSKKDMHLGRKLYYDLQENSEISVNPTMTTRGAALYIVAHVIERVKYWTEAIELFRTIGDLTKGYDIGPNIGGQISQDEKGHPKVTLRRWGTPLTKNPFKPFTGPR